MIGVKQNPQTKALELKDWYAPSNAYWMRKRDLDFSASSPIFDYKGKEYLVDVEQGMPDLAARHERSSAATTIARRRTARRSSATKK